MLLFLEVPVTDATCVKDTKDSRFRSQTSGGIKTKIFFFFHLKILIWEK